MTDTMYFAVEDGYVSFYENYIDLDSGEEADAASLLNDTVLSAIEQLRTAIYLSKTKIPQEI